MSFKHSEYYTSGVLHNPHLTLSCVDSSINVYGRNFSMLLKTVVANPVTSSSSSLVVFNPMEYSLPFAADIKAEGTSTLGTSAGLLNMSSITPGSGNWKGLCVFRN